jgi:hypothetical protein
MILVMRDSAIFDQAVKKFFEPIARKLGLPLVKVRDGVYEVYSPYFIMRLWLDTGHARGLNVILREASHRDFDERAPGIQFGIGCFMEFHGERLQDTFIPVDTDEDFLKRAQLLAQATERYGVPYLLGQGKDFEAVREIKKKEGEEIKKKWENVKFPSFVKKAWVEK